MQIINKSRATVAAVVAALGIGGYASWNSDSSSSTSPCSAPVSTLDKLSFTATALRNTSEYVARGGAARDGVSAREAFDRSYKANEKVVAEQNIWQAMKMPERK